MNNLSTQELCKRLREVKPFAPPCERSCRPIHKGCIRAQAADRLAELERIEARAKEMAEEFPVGRFAKVSDVRVAHYILTGIKDGAYSQPVIDRAIIPQKYHPETGVVITENLPLLHYDEPSTAVEDLIPQKEQK